MSDKTFSIAGYSKLSNGQYKARFANNSVKARTVLLTRAGHSDISLVDLPQKMTKVEAVQFLLGNDAFSQSLPPAAGVALQRVLSAAGSLPTGKPVKAAKSGKGEVRAEIEA